MHACFYGSRLGAQLTHIYQLNKPPPLGSPDCQFPEITEEGVCANQIVYIPTAHNAVRTRAYGLCVTYRLLALLLRDGYIIAQLCGCLRTSCCQSFAPLFMRQSGEVKAVGEMSASP